MHALWIGYQREITPHCLPAVHFARRQQHHHLFFLFGRRMTWISASMLPRTLQILLHAMARMVVF